ncbi:hypothetical protein [Geoalkalibacter sp.]|uniref:hypothetical protein n=1 Tax=Geoalkalibacter sp. TaxID=3041440 RepID=UPI00272DF025|nr:hypothetical protein [Geoalkalibacter sp.]
MAAGSGGRGAAGGRASAPQGTANEQIIPTNQQLQRVKPKGLLSAIGDIQQYYVLEREQDIPGEFLTLEGSLEYWKIGAKSGFNEGLLLFLFFPLVEFYLLPFALKNQGDPSLTLLFHSIPYLMVLFNTLLCLYLAKYFIGTLTRKAVNYLLNGRAMALFGKGCFIALLYYVIARLATPKNVWELADTLFSPQRAHAFYYGFFEIHPLIIPSGLRAFFFISVACFVPYLVVFLRDVLRRRKIRRNLARISGVNP